MAERLGKPRYENTKTRRARLEFLTPTGTFTFSALLKESNIPEACMAGRKPVELHGKCLSFVLPSIQSLTFKLAQLMKWYVYIE